MIKSIFAKIFSIFTKENKNKKEPIYTKEPVIPDHMKEKMLNAKRREDVDILKREHEKKKEEKAIVETINEKIADQKLIDLKIEEENFALLKVDGVYSIGPTIMLTGFVENGRIKKNMKALVNETQIKVIEIRKDMEAVSYLNAGEEGTIEIKAKKNPLLRQGDYLEFE